MTRRSPKFDPLEETMENPDLPPIVAQRAGVAPRVAVRRGSRFALVVASVLVVAFVGLKLVV